MTKMQRFTWEDALIDAQTAGVIPNGALLVALKLSKAINWAPRDKRQPGLYWKNDDALEAVGCGRSSYYRHKDDLFNAGFFSMVNGNLIPTLPESPQVGLSESTGGTGKSLGGTQESLGGTGKSLGGTQESLGGTGKSVGEHPCSEDLLSGESLSVDPLTDSADAPSIQTSDRADGPSLSLEEEPALPLSPKDEEVPVSKSEDDSQKSLGGTVEDYEAAAREAGDDVYFYYIKHMAIPGFKPSAAYKLAIKKAGMEL